MVVLNLTEEEARWLWNTLLVAVAAGYSNEKEEGREEMSNILEKTGVALEQ